MNDLHQTLTDILDRIVVEDLPDAWKDAKFLNQRHIQIDKRGSVGERFFSQALLHLYPRRIEYRDGDQGDWDLKIGKLKFEIKTSTLEEVAEAYKDLLSEAKDGQSHKG